MHRVNHRMAMIINNLTYTDEKDVIANTLRKETAWGGCLEGKGDNWWNYLEVDHKEDEETGSLKAVASTETIWAAECTDIGTVTYDPERDTIYIALRNGWQLQDIEEPVKIQGFHNLPDNTPGPHTLNTYRGKETNVKVSPHLYYAIYIEVQISM